MPEIKPDQLEIVVIFLSFTIFYLLFHFDLPGALFHNLIRRTARSEALSRQFLHRWFGVLLLGVMPGLCALIILNRGPAQYGFTLSFPPRFLVFAVVLCALLFPVLRNHAKGPDAARSIPDLRPDLWSTGLFIVNGFTWACFLVAYELCLRGYLLFSLQRRVGEWPAVIVMTAVYTAVHLPKGRGEAAGSLVMGIVFGFLALLSGSIFIPVTIHLYIAVSSDVMVLLWNRKK
jgi:membrane protease YdiL (CAAX protease family)